jgi:hypothetical protein
MRRFFGSMGSISQVTIESQALKNNMLDDSSVLLNAIRFCCVGVEVSLLSIEECAEVLHSRSQVLSHVGIVELVRGRASVHREHNAEPCLGGHHPVVRFAGLG